MVIKNAVARVVLLVLIMGVEPVVGPIDHLQQKVV